MSSLITSLVENYYVAPLLFNVLSVQMPNGTTKEVHVCMDGKQRLSSLKAFIDGSAHCKDKTGMNWYVPATCSAPTKDAPS